MFAVTFFRRHAYSVFDAHSPRMHGGAEVRAKHFADGLAETGEFEVTFLLGNEGQPEQQTFGKIAVLREPQIWETCFSRAYLGFCQCGSRVARFPWIWLHRFRLALLWQIPLLVFETLIWSRLPASWRRSRPHPLRYFDALHCDAVCCFGTDAGAADIVASAQRRGVPVMVFLIHDWESDASRLSNREYIPELFEFTSRMRYAVENAAAVVVQTERQSELVKECYGREAVVIRNPVNLELDTPPPPPAERRYIFWVGRAESETQGHKRPHLLVELARRLPDLPFVAVMNAIDTRVYETIRREAPSNLRIFERLPREQIEAYFAGAAVFASTSASEGFPNTFLEAAKFSTPIVSLEVDPDGMLEQHGAGLVCQGRLDEMTETLVRLMADPAERTRLGASARAYVECRHELSGRVAELADLLKQCRMAALSRNLSHH